MSIIVQYLININIKKEMFVLNNVLKKINIIMIDINVNKLVKILNHLLKKIIHVYNNVKVDIIEMIAQIFNN